MDASLRCRRRRPKFTVAGLLVALPVLGAACALSAASRAAESGPTRTRAFIGTFDRILIAGFLAGHVPDRGRELDLNEETTRLLRMTLRSKALLNVIQAAPVHLPEIDASGPDGEQAVFNDTAFWKRIGEEYKEPLIVTGTVAFKPDGPQSAEHQVGPRAVTVWRPRFRLDVNLVFISGRTGEVLDSLPLGPVAMRAPDGRTSALALYFDLMDRLTPSVLATFGYPASGSRR